MPRRVLLDNDAMLKLSQYGLLDSALAVLGTDVEAVRVLNTARYSLLPTNNRLKRCKDEAAANRLEAFLEKATPINTDNLDADTLDALTSFQGIDPGEAVLFAAASSDTNALLVTGDKRAIAALSSNYGLSQITSKLEGRIYSLEAIVALLVKKDFELTQHFVRQQPQVDKALTNIFGVSSAASFISVEEGLRSYIQHMRNSTGLLLAYPFS